MEMLGNLMYVSNTLSTYDGETYAILLWAAGGKLLSLIARVNEGVGVYPAAIADENGIEQDCIQITKYL